uniref:RNA-dependent RNA polymerase n=1 Tax=John dory astrovirus FL10 TaxID=2813188 RepID=A0A894JNC9_9VIRU|nr:MAG: RNA-dependent RNA polymerase [John dory astrovirus FL10]
MVEEHFGMRLPPDKVKVFTKFEGVSFCGATYSLKNGHTVPIYNSDKILSSLARPFRRVNSIDDLYCKAFSAHLLLYYSDHKHMLRSLMNQLEPYRTETWFMPDLQIEYLYTMPIA